MSSPVSHEERLHTNYNAVGVAVMQAMYSDDYLSLGGTESTDELALRVGVGPESAVLDVGCGIGGPALHLAGTIGCQVTGIDLVATNIVEARERSVARGLVDRVTFHEGDATALPFPDASFDIVWGQDAWCHVPDKTAMLSEANRVLRPGGQIAFTDWLDGEAMSEAERAAALDAALCTTAATAEQYLELIADAGFVDVAYDDIGLVFRDRYREICDGLIASRAVLIERFGERVYEIVTQMNATIRGGFEGGAIGGGRFLATKPH